MKNDTAYYLGLDIGTDSVGYAATNKQYSLLRFHGDPVWGTTIFEQASQASQRRAFRVNRRRIDRRQQRIKLLQELFAAEVFKKDPRFFIRQEESALYPSDKQEKYSLFNDTDYTDKVYHHRYPTIHHLISELMDSNEPHDVRLVYLACAWLVGHRGHFLSSLDPENVTAFTDFKTVYYSFKEYLSSLGYQVPWSEDNLPAVEEALRLDTGVIKKSKALATALFGGEKVPREKTDVFPFSCDAIIRALSGGQVEAKKLFCQDAYEDLEIKSFSLDMDDTKLQSFLAGIGDDADFVIRLKALFDWAILVDLLGNSGQTISKAKVSIYQQHKKDLAWLKKTIRKYCPDTFNIVFRAGFTNDYNYASYIDHEPTNLNLSSQAAFCKFIKGTLKSVVPDKADEKQFNDVMERLETNRFMPKQKSGDNRVIPYQLYWIELDQLLIHAESYLAFLKQKDSTGLSVSDKIRKVFLFRIPYYVGPLGSHGPNRWVVREPGRITPWNFEEKVDLDKSEEAFIRRMTNSCSYLPGESVLPKDSILYHRFTVLNEINNIKINGVPITVEQKQSIYNDVFLRYPKVTVKRIRDYLTSNGILSKNDVLSGIDTAIKSDLKPQHDFRILFESHILTEKDIEAIILRRTYSEEPARFKRWLKTNYPFLSKEEVRYLTRLNYKDFGRLSRRFLAEIEGENRVTGEITTIMQALWETNDNLMEILSEKYSFRQNVEAEAHQWYIDHPLSIRERLADMYVPSAVCRSVFRALEICKEVVKAFGKAPEKIFVEMARGGRPEQKGKRTLSRYDQLLALYEQCHDNDVRLLQKQLEEMGDSANTKLQSDKLFLYYLQLGRCMYTNLPIDLQELMSDKRYDIDHIYPQSLVKDDSLFINKVLVLSEENGRKGNGLVPSDIQAKMHGWWEHLKAYSLITEEKYQRLTRSIPFSDDEKWGFINRQMTETTQSTKAVASLLKEIYPDTEIIYVKAHLVSEFRQAFDCIKSRDFNDLHHAKDAYLNIVVGNVYHERFSRRWFSPDSCYSVKLETIFTHSVICGGETVWEGTPLLEKVKSTIHRNNAHYTRYSYRKQGAFFDVQPVKKATGLVPRKKGLDTEKYGGYNKASISFFILAKYTIANKDDVMFLPVELLFADKFLLEPEFRIIYAQHRIEKIWGKPVKSVSFPLGDRILRVNTMLSLDGFIVCITGVSSYGKAIMLSGQVPFAGGYDIERYLKRLRSLQEKHTKNPLYLFDPEIDKVNMEENLKLYDLYIEKLENSIFKNRPNHPLETLKTGKEAFAALDIWTQIEALLNIHTVFGRANTGVDLSSLCGASNAAVSKKKSAIRDWRKMYQDVRIVDRSAAGLWETRSQNLLDLL